MTLLSVWQCDRCGLRSPVVPGYPEGWMQVTMDDWLSKFHESRIFCPDHAQQFKEAVGDRPV